MQITVKGAVPIPGHATMEAVEEVGEKLRGYGKVSVVLPRELRFELTIDGDEDPDVPAAMLDAIGPGQSHVRDGKAHAAALGWAAAGLTREADAWLLAESWDTIKWDECEWVAA